jgi:hypothetical protein
MARFFNAGSTIESVSLSDLIDKKADTLLQKNRFFLFDRVRLAATSVFIMGKVPAETAEVFTRLAEVCALTQIVETITELEILCDALPTDHTPLLLLNASISSDLCTNLLDLRRSRPEIVILLTSSEFLRNDFSIERGAICDASLRAPYTVVALALGITAAFNNHSEMRQRSLYHWASR